MTITMPVCSATAAWSERGSIIGLARDPLLIDRLEHVDAVDRVPVRREELHAAGDDDVVTEARVIV
jgi:hypothetical protein